MAVPFMTGVSSGMIWVAIILLILIVVVTFILVTPLIIYVDTDEKKYAARLRGICQVMLDPDQSFRPRVRLFGIPISIPAARKEKPRKASAEKKKKTPGWVSRKTPKDWLALVGSLLKSFHVTAFQADIDTGDVVVNAELTPVAMALSQRQVKLHTNFNGVVYVHCEIHNRLIRLLWIFLNFITKK